MKDPGLRCAVIVVTLLVAGCSGTPGVAAYRPVDLTGDLDPATLSRYRAEAERARAAGQTGRALVLEQTNWWLPGVLAYWRRGSVRGMETTDGERHYTVSASTGYGPLSVLYVDEQTATYRADGRRVGAHSGFSLLWGHLAMNHTMESRGPDGRWGRSDAIHLVHHLVNWGSRHGRSWFSLFSAPNPVGLGQ
ncbi:MAG: hypothetical protein R6X33_05910 [Candidatus Brocadiia bacterium]